MIKPHHVYLSVILIISTVHTGIGNAASIQRAGRQSPSVNRIGHQIGVGVVYHKTHSDFETLPFRDGDLTYTMSYEYHEGIGYWLLGIGFTPSVDGNDAIDHIITPELSLVIKDRIYRAGVGILKSYISDKNDEIDNTDIYYRFNLGLNLPISAHFCIDLNGLYVFEKWRDIDFEFGDIEYGMIFNYIF